MRSLFAGLLMALCLAAPALAAPLVAPGSCEVIAASRPSLGEARAYANGLDNRHAARIFESRNGWYAISVGTLETRDAERVLESWRQSGWVPRDAYCSTGGNYLTEHALSGGTRAPAARQPAPPVQASGTLYVDSPRDGFLNLRSGPGSGYAVLRRMPHGEGVSVLERQGSWLRLRDGTGTTGWAHGDYLGQRQAQAPVRTAPPAAKPKSSGEDAALTGIAIALGVLGLMLSDDSAQTPSNESRIDAYCRKLPTPDQRGACLLRPYDIQNRDARAIVEGRCGGLSDTARAYGLDQVCWGQSRGACDAISDTRIRAACASCNGNRRWSATAAAGHSFSCGS